MDVQENWSGRTFSLTNPWTAGREFTVARANSAYEALNAPGIPKAKEQHPSAPLLTCEGSVIRSVLGPTYFVIGSTYSLDPLTRGADPLKDEPEITWEDVEECLPCDIDVVARTIVNSARMPIPGLSQPVNFKRLTIVKNMPNFDPLLGQKFGNAVNSKPLTLSGIVTIATEHFRCATIGPAKTYMPSVKVMPMRFVFEMFFDDSRGKFPFQHRVLDIGDEGWYTDPADAEKQIRAKFTQPGSGGEWAAVSDIRLDGTGKPLAGLHPNVKVGDGFDPVSIASAPKRYAIEYYESDGKIQGGLNVNTAAAFIYFQRARVVDMTPLTALF